MRPTRRARVPETTAALVTLLPDNHGLPRVVADPSGLLDPTRGGHSPLLRAATVTGRTGSVTWAWGWVAPEQSTPRVRFTRCWGLRRRAAPVRRLSATVWAAQIPGRWHRVSVR